MGMTRDELITLSDNLADAVSSERWSSTLKLQLLGRVHRAEWRKILNANRWYRMNDVALTTDTDGRVDISALTTGSGDSIKTFYRVLSVNVGQYFLQESQYELSPTPQYGAYGNGMWYRRGEEIQVSPLQPSVDITFLVNWVPQRADLLSAGTIEVPYVDDYELILANMTAAYMLNKGAAESDAAKVLRSEANDMRNDMMQDVRRTGTRPQRLTMQDSPEQWGG